MLRLLPIAILLAAAPAAAADDSRANGEPLVQAAAVILDDSVPKEQREALITKHKADSTRLLRLMTDDLAPGTPEELRRIPWIWRVTVAAGKRNEIAELADILDASLPKSDGELLEWQAVVIGGGVINGIGLVGAWPAERIEAILEKRPDLRPRWNRALEQALAMADDENIIPGTRYDALRMIALLDWKTARPILERYLGHENAELQQGAVSGLSDVQNDEAPRLLLANIGDLTTSNRAMAVDALARDDGRTAMAKEALRQGVLTRKEITEATKRVESRK